MKTKPTKGLVFLKIPKDNLGGVNFDCPNGSKFRISTKFHKEKFYPQYSEVVAVADDITEIKVGDFVFHNHNAIGELREVEKDIYYQPINLIYGTKDKMIGDYIMVEPFFTEKEVISGTFSNPRILTVQEESKLKVNVILGDIGVYYCSPRMFYEIVGSDRKLYIANKKELLCDEQLNPIGEKTVVFVEEKKQEGLIEFTRKDNFQKGIVFKSEKYHEKIVHFFKNKATELTFLNQTLYIVEDKYIFGVNN